MPELPEVETICRQLEPEIEGRRFAARQQDGDGSMDFNHSARTHVEG